MRVLPRTDADLVDWMDQRLARWDADPAAIGLEPGDLALLVAELDAAREALATARIARNEARARTAEWRTAGSRVRDLIARLVRSIKVHAEAVGDPSILADAEIPPPKTPSRLGPPEAPQIRSIAMPVGGHLDIEWSGSTKGGTQFVIFRQVLLAGGISEPFAMLDTSPRTRYRDRSIPARAVGAAYTIEARRTGGTSPKSAVVSFSFAGPGINASGQVAA